MGDQIAADLPQESEVPPLPPKTYQWKDIRRQKLEGRYPWTHLYKEPFDNTKWEEANEHEYELVIPMDIHKAPPPIVKITPDRECPLLGARQNTDLRKSNQDKNRLLVPPPGNEYDDTENSDENNDSDSDPSEEITAEELQHRLEEKYFRSPSPASSSIATNTKNEYERSKARSISPALTDDHPSSSHSNTEDTPKLSHKMQQQADKLRHKFKSFKEQISKEYTNCSPRSKRKASLDEPVVSTGVKHSKAKIGKETKKNKFNFRRRAVKKSAAPPKLPSEPDLRNSDEQPSTQSDLRRFSFRSLHSFQRSPSASSSIKERKRSLSSESSSSKKKFDFHFGTYPRGIFSKRCKTVDEPSDGTSVGSKPKSAPGTPLPRRSPFSQRLMSKLTIERKKQPKKSHETVNPVDKDENTTNVVKETIFISLHENNIKQPKKLTDSKSETKRPNSPIGLPPTPPETAQPTKIEIDNKNFFFISLHEERFPEKLQKNNSHPTEFSQEEIKIECELKKARTARKFHHMLRRMEMDRKLKARQTGRNDDKPEPVVITEIPADDEDDSFRGTQGVVNCVQTPEEENVVFGSCQAEEVPPEKLVFEGKESTGKHETLFKSLGKIEIGKKIGLDKLKFGKKSPPAGKDIKYDSKMELKDEIKPNNQHILESKLDPIAVPPIPSGLTSQITTTESPHRVNNHCEVEVQISSQPESIPEEEILIAPKKMPRKKLKPSGSERESKESLSAFEDTSFTDAIILDEQKSYTKTYIKESLDEIPLSMEEMEPEQTATEFKEYERALETSKNQRSFEVKNNLYSPQNTLAHLEMPIPPSRPNRKGTLPRDKHEKSLIQEHKGNVYNPQANQNFNTFPLMKPDKPKRKFRKPRTYSNSTNNTENMEMKNIDELEDDTINQNIVNSKQLSVSFLPLSSNIVGEPITDYNLRETSSMIHINFDPPLPPKRRKGPVRNDASQKYNTMPNQKYVSKTSLSTSETYNLDLNIDGEIEYADDVNSTVLDSDSPPKRPTRRRSTGPSTADEDRTSRGIESISSEQSSKDELDLGYDLKEVHGYATIDTPAAPRLSQTQSEGCNSQSDSSRRKSRRFSDFFTFPRIRIPTNYVPTSTQTLDRRRLPSPSRPPRRNRAHLESTYVNDDHGNNLPPQQPHLEPSQVMTFDGEEQLNFNLATDEDTVNRGEDTKNLQTDDILEKMKTRPLPPPPRPTRKPREDAKSEHYSESTKKRSTAVANTLGQSVVEEKIVITSITAGGQRTETESKNWLINECSNLNTRFEHQSQGVETQISEVRLGSAATIESSVDTSSTTMQHRWNIQPSTENIKTETRNERGNTNPQEKKVEMRNSDGQEKLMQNPLSYGTQRTTVHPDQSECPPSNTKSSAVNLSENPTPSGTFNSITASRLEISELNVAKLNVGEIESSRLLTSMVDSSRLQVSSIQGEAGTLLLNSVEFGQNEYPCPITQNPNLMVEQREMTPSSEDAASEMAKQRSRISSMITEVGSDEESNSNATKVVRPHRRKQSSKRLSEASCSHSSTQGDRPTLSELMCQILQICHSSVGQAIHSLLEQVIPEDREKRNEVQAAIWVITIIVAGCLMLGLQSNEKIVHHHHWDFHFPPPH